VSRGATRVAVALAAGALAAGASSCGGETGQARTDAAPGCAPLRTHAAAPAQVRSALAATADVWGNELLGAPGGPGDEAARRYLAPLLLARAPGRRPLTASGYHYIPFGVPRGDAGTTDVALHVADGSQIITRHVGGRALSVLVGSDGRERYGSCRSRLALPRLADGWLPILETTYADATGAAYEQESFAARTGPGGRLVSFVRLSVDAGAAPVLVRFVPGPLLRIGSGERRTLYLARPNRQDGGARLVEAGTYDAARRSLVRFWESRLARGTRIVVPEERVDDALRALLVQNLVLAWRYSIGNPYEEFSFPEGVDVAQVMGELGFEGVSRAIMRRSLTTRPTPYPNWKRGEKLLGSAAHYRLSHDRAFVDQVTPTLRRYVAELDAQLRASPYSLLARDRYSSDIEDPVYGLHAQAVAWQGIREMGIVWAETGRPGLARESARTAERLGAGLRRAVARSSRRLPDGSLFVPVRLLDPERPYTTLTEARPGSYWNLVMPYALASGLFPARGTVSDGVWAYLQRHGSRLLGLVRAGAYALYGRSAHPKTGTDQVYGNDVARFLADSDRPDQLVLSLYGSLAAAMAPGTFVSGEAASVAPLGDSPLRSMYLPPNGASNAAFLETVRLMLVHETRRADGRPGGLDLALATPRAWLRAGRRISVTGVPTSFGPVTYVLQAEAATVRAVVSVPSRSAPPRLRLRLRLPDGHRITSVAANGRTLGRWSARTETIDLSGLRGRVELVVRHARPG
jgi:hypothetical protein